MEPTTLGALLREISIYYDLDGDRHRAIAYERAAGSIEAANGLHLLVEENRLEELPNIGPSTARVVGDLWRRGHTDILDKHRAKWPPVVVELAMLPKVGAKRAREIWQKFQPADLEVVANLCRDGAIRTMKGFGAVSEAGILTAIDDRRLRGVRAILIDAIDTARGLAGHLATLGRVEIAGPVRRGIEIVEYLAFAVAHPDLDAVLDRVAAFALTTSMDRAAHAANLAGGMRAQFYAAAPERFGWCLLEATGSEMHVAKLRERASGQDIQAPEERDIYTRLGLPFIPPEVRDGTDELDVRDWSHLVERADVTTAFHCHTTYSDGKASILEMAQAAADRGFSAITITDHSAAASYAGGIGAAGLTAQRAEVSGLAPPIKILRGIEADILVDGEIDVPRELVPDLDLVIASVHQRFKLEADAATERVVRAMRQPFFKIWGHALGRLVLKRDPMPLHLETVLDAIAESPAAVEINGDPYRLDLAPDNARLAAARGIRFVLSCDAHSTNGLDAIHYAVTMARRARLPKSQILNTLPPDELAAAIRPL